MNKKDITLIRDDGSDSNEASNLLQKSQLAFVEVFAADDSVKPYLSVRGFAQGFEGLLGVQYFVESEVWKQVGADSGVDHASIETALSRILEIAKAYKPNASPPDLVNLAQIFNVFDKLLQDCKFREVDALLTRIDPSGMSASVLIAILTATLPARHHLKARSALFSEIEREFQQAGKTDPRLLAGLG